MSTELPSVFLSYSHEDRDLAKRIARDLAREKIAVWLDEWEILIGDSITQRVQQGLNQVDFIILLLTARSVGSGWMEKEWQSQVGVEAEKRQVRILPVKGGACEIPLLLRDKRCANLNTDYRQGLSELVRAIHEHSGRHIAVSSESMSLDRYLPLKRMGRSAKWQGALIIFALLALVGFWIYQMQVGTSNHVDVADGYDKTAFSVKRPNIVPPAESYRIREVRQPSVPEYSKFEILEDRRVIDLRDWKPFERGAQERISPVTWSRKVRLRKSAEAEQVRFAFATEGAGIDAACVSGQDYYLETGIISCDPPQLLLKTLQVVVNVAKYSVGEEFQIEIQATFWNGSFDQEDWTAYKVYAPVKIMSMMILFPEQKAFKWKKLVMYKEGKPDEQTPPEDQRNVIYLPDNQALYWEIREPIPNNTYEIQWGW
jgi:hypothetical protein